MGKIVRIFFTALFAIVIAPSLMAQIEMDRSIISASGGFSETDNFSISWTLGELAITSLNGDHMILTQGFQQALNAGTGVTKNEPNWNILVYPNPVHDILNIHFDLRESKDFLIELQDVSGRILKQVPLQNILPGDLMHINFSDFVSGVYFLRILTPDFRQVKVTSLRKL